jgi:hypothetical protein
MSDLMQKLALSKKIMDAQNKIPRGGIASNGEMPMSMDESIPEARYNIPQEMVLETKQPSQMNVSRPASQDRILGSKLPEDIKKLMIENPIVQPNSVGGGDSVLSDEIIQGATRLMGTKKPQVQESHTPQHNNSFDMSELKQMVRDVVRDTVRDVVREELKSSGVISETTSNDSLQLKVGSHIFEGKVTKIKKIR